MPNCGHCRNCLGAGYPDEVGGLCMLEMKPVCPQCHARGVCDPFEKKLARMEARGKLLAAVG